MRKNNSWDRVLNALTHPMTYHHLSTLVCLHPRTTARILRDMERSGLVHIYRWVHVYAQGPHAALYMQGEGVSAKRPKSLSNSKRTKRYRAQMSEAERESRLARRRKVKPDIASSWLFGGERERVPAA